MHNDQETIELCFLQDYPSLKHALRSLGNYSGSHIKKWGPKAKILNSQVKKFSQVSLSINLINNKLINPVYEGERDLFIEETDDFIILSKPVRVHSHPLKYTEKNNLLSYLYVEKKYRELQVNQEQYDRGLLYRLDFETSGLMIYAKKKEIYEHARTHKNFFKRKKYLAVVSGDLHVSGKLAHYLISKGKKNHLVQASKQECPNALKADCSIQKIMYNSKEDLSLVEVILKQGHRHQIRVQLQEIGYPILGDPLYGDRSFERMLLHCYEYILDYHGQKRTFRDANLSSFSRFFDLNGKF